jgi:hypothetical protein
MNVRSLRHGLLLALALPLAGCQLLDATTTAKDAPPEGTPCRVLAVWQPDVRFAPDPVHNGALNPGLAGRVYLTDDLDNQLAGNGNLVVDLYECGGGEPVLKEEWRIDPKTLKLYLRKDVWGWGYTVFLPWATYRPDMTQVQLQVKYQPPQGVPLFSDQSRVTLNHPVEPGMPAGPPTAVAARPKQ